LALLLQQHKLPTTTEPEYFILFKNIILDEVKSVSGPNDYNRKNLESRKEQGFYAFFMHTELTQQEVMFACLSVRTGMINFNCTKNVNYANNEVFEACS